MYLKIKKRTFEILEVAKPGDIPSRTFDIFIMGLISVNVIAVILETVKSLSIQYSIFFRNFEIFSIAVFTIEYILRIWTCTINEKFRQPILGRIQFALTPLLVVDLMAILPFYLPMFIPLDLRFLRILRLIRIFRMFKMARYSESLKILGNVFRTKKEDLFITVFVISILLIVASSLMYFIENKAQPEAFSSIPQAMWWGVVTLTTVGYGDIYPITPAGKILGAIISLLGISIFALPTGILVSGFIEEIQRQQNSPKICPHCGKLINFCPPKTDRGWKK
jgi:voltage-gated potassium channel